MKLKRRQNVYHRTKLAFNLQIGCWVYLLIVVRKSRLSSSGSAEASQVMRATCGGEIKQIDRQKHESKIEEQKRQWRPWRTWCRGKHCRWGKISLLRFRKSIVCCSFADSVFCLGDQFLSSPKAQIRPKVLVDLQIWTMREHHRIGITTIWRHQFEFHLWQERCLWQQLTFAELNEVVLALCGVTRVG